jgi:hypothetical protein
MYKEVREYLNINTSQLDISSETYFHVTEPSDVPRYSYADVRRLKRQDVKMTTVKNAYDVNDPLGLNVDIEYPSVIYLNVGIE